jgi:hypothetical protein
MIKRTVGLRPIKYSKLPTNVSVGLFSAQDYEKQAIKESFMKFNKNGNIRDESDMRKDWQMGKDATDLDYVLLFSQISHSDLKDIWYMTGCDKIMKFASFNRIYNQCVCGQDILWVNCLSVEHIQQKIRWDKLIIKSLNPTYTSSTSLIHDENIVGPVDIQPNNVTIRDDEVVADDKVIGDDNIIKGQEKDDVGENSEIQNSEITFNKKSEIQNEEYSIVNVFDTTDNGIRTWVYNLPKKIVSLDDDKLDENSHDNNEACNIL